MLLHITSCSQALPLPCTQLLRLTFDPSVQKSEGEPGSKHHVNDVQVEKLSNWRGQGAQIAPAIRCNRDRKNTSPVERGSYGVQHVRAVMPS